MRFTDGETVWELSSFPDWVDWAQNRYEDDDVIRDYIIEGFDELWPVKIGNVEFSAYALLEKADPCYLSQMMDWEIEAFADNAKCWLEQDGEFKIRGAYTERRYWVTDESDNGED